MGTYRIDPLAADATAGARTRGTDAEGRPVFVTLLGELGDPICDWLDGLEDDARAAGGPGVARLLEIGSSGGAVFAVEEGDGTALPVDVLARAARAQDRPFGLGSCAWLAMRVCESIAQSGWPHLRLSPHNVFVTSSGEPLVLGLAYARLLPASADEASAAARANLGPEDPRLDSLLVERVAATLAGAGGDNLFGALLPGSAAGASSPAALRPAQLADALRAALALLDRRPDAAAMAAAVQSLRLGTRPPTHSLILHPLPASGAPLARAPGGPSAAPSVHPVPPGGSSAALAAIRGAAPASGFGAAVPAEERLDAGAAAPPPQALFASAGAPLAREERPLPPVARGAPEPLELDEASLAHARTATEESAAPTAPFDRPGRSSPSARVASGVARAARRLVGALAVLAVLGGAAWWAAPRLLGGAGPGALLQRASGKPDYSRPLLWVESEPAGARVTVAGRQLGETPLVADNDFPEGEHTLRVALEGYSPRTVRFRGRADLKLRLNLTRK